MLTTRQTARQSLVDFHATWPTPEQSADPAIKALEARAEAEYQAELLVNPQAMLARAESLKRSAARHDKTALDYEAGAKARFACGNDDVAREWVSMGETARECAADARAEAAELRARAGGVRAAA